MEKNLVYLKQVIVVRKDLCMPRGKIAAMAAHAAMTFILKGLKDKLIDDNALDSPHGLSTYFSQEELRWMTELDPGLEDQDQISMAKIVLEADSEEHLLSVEKAAKEANLTVHRVIDCGYSHNKPNTLTCIAIGPHWPEDLRPVTGSLKLLR